VELLRDLRMQLETPPRHPIERGAAAPVERQEAAGFAGRGARDGMTFDHDGHGAAPAEQIRDGDADRAAAADDDAPSHTLTLSRRAIAVTRDPRYLSRLAGLMEDASSLPEVVVQGRVVPRRLLDVAAGAVAGRDLGRHRFSAQHRASAGRLDARRRPARAGR